MTRTALAACLLLALAAPARAADDPDALRLQARVNALRADPALGRLAAFEQMEAQEAVTALADARRSEREGALYVAQRRVVPGGGDGGRGSGNGRCRGGRGRVAHG